MLVYLRDRSALKIASAVTLRQTYCPSQPQRSDTGPTSRSTDQISPDSRLDGHWKYQFLSLWYYPTLKSERGGGGGGVKGELGWGQVVLPRLPLMGWTRFRRDDLKWAYKQTKQQQQTENSHWNKQKKRKGYIEERDSENRGGRGGVGGGRGRGGAEPFSCFSRRADFYKRIVCLSFIGLMVQPIK